MSNVTYDKRIRAALEYGPLVLFLVAYWYAKDRSFDIWGVTYSGFIVVTAAFVLVFVASILALWRLTGKLSPMQVVTLVVVLFMGGLSVWFNDEHFFKMKPTYIYVFFSGALGIGLLQGKSYLRLVMHEALALQPEGWMILTRRIAVFFAVLAVTNEIVWRNFSTDTWVWFKAVGLTAAMFLFLLTQAGVLNRYGIEEPPEKP